LPGGAKNWGMTMNDFRSDDDFDLDAVFKAAQRQAPKPTVDLLARIEADALSAQEEIQKARAAIPRRSGFRGLLPAFGGWLGMAGLAASVVIGIGIGFWQPVDLGLGTSQAGADVLEEPFFLSFEDALAEG